MPIQSFEFDLDWNQEQSFGFARASGRSSHLACVVCGIQGLVSFWRQSSSIRRAVDIEGTKTVISSRN